jgi:hypothetical protein
MTTSVAQTQPRTENTISSGLLAGLGIVWLAFPYLSQTQVYNQQLDELSYAKVIEQIKSQNPRSSGG